MMDPNSIKPPPENNPSNYGYSKPFRHGSHHGKRGRRMPNVTQAFYEEVNWKDKIDKVNDYMQKLNVSQKFEDDFEKMNYFAYCSIYETYNEEEIYNKFKEVFMKYFDIKLIGQRNSPYYTFENNKEEFENIFKIVFEGNSEEAKIYEVNDKFSFEKDERDLSTLIYAIWGKNKKILKLLVEVIRRKKEHIPDVKNELGHLLIDTKKGSKLLIDAFKIVCLHSPISLKYMFENIKEPKTESVMKWIIKDENMIKKNILIESIREKSIDCTNIILEYLISSDSQEVFDKFIYSIESNLEELFNSSSSFLGKFLDKFIKSEKILANVNSNVLPLLIEDTTISPKEKLKTVFTTHINTLYKSINLESKYTLIKLPCISGSAKSCELLKSLYFTPVTKIFRSSIIKYYILYKWNALWIWAFAFSLMIWANLLLIILMLLYPAEIMEYMLPFIVINVLLLISEVIQLLSLGPFRYLGNTEPYDAFYALYYVFIILQYFWLNIPLFILSTLAYLGKGYLKRENKKTSKENKTTNNGLNYNNAVVKTSFEIAFLALALSMIFCIEKKYDSIEFISFFTIQCLVILFFSYFCVREFLKSYHFSIVLYAKILVILLIATYPLNPQSYIWPVLIYELFALLSISIVTYCTRRLFGSLNNFSIIDFLVPLLSLGWAITNYYYLDFPSWSYMVLIILAVIDDYCLRLHFYNSQEKKNYLKTIEYKPSIMIFPILILMIIKDYPLGVYVFSVFFVIELISESVNKSNFVLDILGSINTLVFNWNVVDCIRFLITGYFLYETFVFSEASTEVIWLMVVMNFLRGLTGFRIFSGTRYYIRLILRSITDLQAFMAIFLYTTLAFGVINSIDDSKEITLEKIWIWSFDLDLGNVNHNSVFNIRYLIFFAASVINVIIMLNLLISILGDSFDRFQVSATESDYMEMTDCIYEIECIMFWNRNRNELFPLLIWDSLESGVDSMDSRWEGRLMMLEKSMKKNTDLIIQEISGRFKK
ncbi:hypothetical protein SteCoe_4025 [Stentor coeruleus]|uniref:Ion transport domain-containing protein n=1 Tax=Stentor coeruleus TaxID=5963 RepID=A0A1R2CVT5_9CILI|nr:hypothetical protein SteCoe_4025 [Stentor coeruleus]